MNLVHIDRITLFQLFDLLISVEQEVAEHVLANLCVHDLSEPLESDRAKFFLMLCDTRINLTRVVVVHQS